MLYGLIFLGITASALLPEAETEVTEVAVSQENKERGSLNQQLALLHSMIEEVQKQNNELKEFRENDFKTLRNEIFILNQRYFQDQKRYLQVIQELQTQNLYLKTLHEENREAVQSELLALQKQLLQEKEFLAEEIQRFEQIHRETLQREVSDLDQRFFKEKQAHLEHVTTIEQELDLINKKVHWLDQSAIKKFSSQAGNLVATATLPQYEEAPQDNLLAPVFERFHNDNQVLAQSPQAQEIQNNKQDCASSFHTMRVGLRHIEANGIGYTNGYTTLEGFGIYDRHQGFMPFLDLRGHLFDNGKLAGNAGIGARSFLRSINHLLGYYLYYDIRQGGHHLTAQQLSPGIELLSKRMEYRMNGYFPVGNQKSHPYHYAFEAFKGNSIFLKYKKQYVMKGADAEIGVHIAEGRNYDLYTGIGPYYFQASHDQSWGGKIRLNGKYKQYITAEASYSYDHLFGNIFQGSIGISIPFGKKIRLKNNCSNNTTFLAAREAQSPYRFEIPVIKKHRAVTKAINPSTNEPWVVWFVDNTSSSLGTFNSPFPTLAEAQSASAPNEIIYVFPGDGTTTGLNAGITLQNNQKLFGSGISQSIPTTQGTITIPQFSTTSPVITNASGSVIFLANNNEISGLNLTTNLGTTPTLIFGSNISSGNIHDNNLFASVAHEGIQITGIGFYNIQNNHCFGPSGAGNAIGFAPNNGGIIATIKNNVVVGYSNSLLLNADVMSGSGGEFIVIGNTFSEATFRAIFFQSFDVNSGSILTIDNNTISSITTNAINIETNENLCLTVNNNLISNSGQDALYIENDGSSTTAFIKNNTISGVGAGFYGIECLTFDPFCLVLNNNVVTGGAGFFLDSGMNGQLSVDLSGNEGTLTTSTSSGGTITLVPASTCSCSDE
jgi:hypothetical protein